MEEEDNENEEEVEKQEEKKPVNTQTKVNIELKLSRNYNTVTFGIQDEPIPSATEEEFREGLSKKADILRQEAEKELTLIGSAPN